MNIDESYLDYYQGPPSDHFNGETFFNPWAPRPKKGLMDVLKWRMQGTRATWPERVENPPRPPLEPSPKTPRVTYIGHASFLVQAHGRNILIDPVFSERCSPFSFIGPKRVRDPFVPLEKLPKIDFVFVSHNHYDHLDQPTLAWLAANHQPVMIAPLGTTRLVKACTQGCGIVALDWHQSTEIGDSVKLTLTPAQHWSRRGFDDINRDLWGAAIITLKNGKSVYYAGDSGYHEGLYKQTAERYGAPDIALLPIGAYEPRWFMKYSHMNPDEAIQTHRTLGAKRSIGFHFETFQLTDEAFDAPRKHTLAALKKYKVPEGDFLIPTPGDFMAL